MIHSILVPTDFSDCAQNAFEAAAKFAHRFNARLFLFSSIDLPENWETLTQYEKKQNHSASQLIENTESHFDKLKAVHPGLKISTHYGLGNLVEVLPDFVDRHGIDLVIMGSHGASGKSEYFIGSNTQKVVRKLHCPVLVIKEPLESIDFDKVVFASNFHESEKASFLRFKQLVSPFVPEIYLLEVHASSLINTPYIVSKQAMSNFAKLCAPFSCKTVVHRDYSVDRGVRFFAEEIGAKLIGISNHNRRPLKRMLVGSKVEALVNHADVPVLSIDFKEDQ